MKGATEASVKISRDDIVSIHAPVKGATRPDHHRRALVLVVSIHAPVKGATLPPARDHRIQQRFNPRSREGSDDAMADRIYRFHEFQSTLP